MVGCQGRAVETENREYVFPGFGSDKNPQRHKHRRCKALPYNIFYCTGESRIAVLYFYHI